jgi:hypothetical protein
MGNGKTHLGGKYSKNSGNEEGRFLSSTTSICLYANSFRVAIICLDIRVHFRIIHYQNFDLNVLPTHLWNELDDLDMSYTFDALGSWKYDCTSRLPRPDSLFLGRDP